MFSGLIDKIKGNKEERPHLDHPKDLMKGDMIEMGLSPLSELNNQTFKVVEANTVNYGDGNETSLVIEGSGQRYGLYVGDDDEGEFLQFSKMIKRKQVGAIFGLDKFGGLFQEGMGWRAKAISSPNGLEDWIADAEYFKTTDALTSTFAKDDYRAVDRLTGKEEFDYYELSTGDEDFLVEIEVYDGGETEVYLCRKLPMHTIDRIWPTND